jgi:hypothetical protein
MRRQFVLATVLLVLSCKGSEGPTGPSGTAGVPGQPGTQGPPGPAGVAGFQVVKQTIPLPAGNSREMSVVVSCPSGKVAVGGGFGRVAYAIELDPGSGTIPQLESHPDEANAANWVFVVYYGGPYSGAWPIYVTCISPQ